MSKFYKTEAIVVRQLKYGETSLILDMYTREKGMRSFIVNGIRGKNSKSAIYQIMNQLDIVAYDSGSQKLNRIKETKLSNIYQTIGRNMVKSSIGIFMMDLFKQSVKEHEENENLYTFLLKSLNILDQSSETLSIFPIVFTLGLSDQLGFFPQNNFSNMTPRFSLMEGAFVSEHETSQYILSLDLSLVLANMLTYLTNDHILVSPNKAIRKELLNQLINFYKLQLDGFGELKSLQVMQSLFE
jgi:DNA repair protein RecO (recombination protein O)